MRRTGTGNGTIGRLAPTRRLLRLIVLLSGSRGYSIFDLSKQLEVGTKTIRRDLRAIEDLEIPLYEDDEADMDHRAGHATKLWRVDRHWMRRFV